MSNVFGVVMAGGVGTRFWPRSREKTPKQALEISGKGTMIQNTAGRLMRLVPPEDLYIITNRPGATRRPVSAWLLCTSGDSIPTPS
jgi:mannose-1-phosphate guanylyltransferase